MSGFLKKLLITIAFFALTGGSFGIGILVAQLKLNAQKNAQGVPVLSQKEKTAKEIEAIPENVVIPQEEVTVDPPKEIVTEPEKKEEIKFSFAVIGDTQNDPNNSSGNLAQASRSLAKQDVKFILATGDIVSSCDGGSKCDGKLAKWKSFFKQKTYPVQGNHDRVGEEKADKAWQNFFDLPRNGPAGFSELVYSFDYANSHFVALASDNPKENLINSTQRKWLESDLARNKQKNIFVFFHEPAYPTNSKIGESLDENPSERNALWVILKKYKVTAVFSGHEHIQSRRKVDGVYQFGFGNTDAFNHLAPKPGTTEYSFVGSGYGLVSVVDAQVTVKTLSVNGALLNSFVIPR